MRSMVTRIMLPALAGAGVLLAGCGPESGGGLALQIHYNPGDGPQQLRSNDPPPDGTAPDDITDYRVCVSAPDMNKPKCQNFNRADHPSGAKLGGLKPGSDRRVTFQGYDVGAEYAVRWCGNVAGVEVKGDKTTTVSMYISACSDFTAVRNAMQHRRAFHTATRLRDGRVLVAGGFASLSGPAACSGGSCYTLSATSSIDIYNPRTGQFDPSSGLELIHPRGLHSASLLPDGRVLIAGGAAKAIWRVSFPDGPLPVIEVDTGAGGDDSLAGNSAELIDPASNSVEEINLTTARADHRALSFSSGDVLLLNGLAPATNQPLDSFSRYAVDQVGFSDIGNAANAPRQGMAVAEFAEHTFLIWGGNHADSAEPGPFAEVVYEEAGGEVFVFQPQFVLTAESSRGDPAFYAAAASPAANQVLVTGGMIVDEAYDDSLSNRVRILNTFRLCDMAPQNESFADTGNETLRFPRAFHTASALAASPVDGEVMVAGGATYYDPGSQSFELTERVEFFSTATNIFEEKQIESRSVTLLEPRAGHAVAPLDDGSVFLSGGLTTNGSGLDISDTAEIYNPAPRSLRVE